MNSLRVRVLVSLAAVLAVFFGATIVALDWSLGSSLARNRAEILEAHLIALMAAAEPHEQGLSLAVPILPDRRLTAPESGLYGEIREADGSVLWRSPSTLAGALEPPVPGRPGVRDQRTVDNGAGIAQRSVTVDWEFDDGEVRRFQFVVAQSLEPYRAQQRGFRVGLASWFGGLTLATVALLALLLGRQLRPLGTLERQIGELEAGARETLEGRFPRELHGVVRNLNALLARERGRQQRYRDSLANLAHSLKTPLAAMQARLAAGGDDVAGGLQADIDRMDRLIGHQLKRASSIAGHAPGVRPVELAPLVDDLVESLTKIHAERRLSIEVDIPRELTAYGDEGDLQEMLGNLLDNACKFGDRSVRCSALTDDGWLRISVEDDGPGLDPAAADQALERGTRLDRSRPGHGIGLAVVADIVAGAGGTLEIGASPLGGAAMTVTLPAAR